VKKSCKWVDGKCIEIDDCSRCGEGSFDVCDKEECYKIGNCYMSGLFTCKSCRELKSCLEIKDEEKCEDLECTKLAGLECEWVNGVCGAKRKEEKVEKKEEEKFEETAAAIEKDIYLYVKAGREFTKARFLSHTDKIKIGEDEDLILYAYAINKSSGRYCDIIKTGTQKGSENEIEFKIEDYKRGIKKLTLLTKKNGKFWIDARLSTNPEKRVVSSWFYLEVEKKQ